MCRDRHPEIFWKSGQIWQNDQSGRGEIWQFGFSQGPGGAGIHPGGFVLMSGPQKPNYFPIWAILGVSSGIFSHIIPLFGGSPWPLLAPIGSYWPLLAPIGPYWPLLAAIGPYWPPLAPIGFYWPPLAHIGKLFKTRGC